MTVEIKARACDACGETKPDVELRSWDGVDAAEWDFLCASCLKKKEREMTYFWRGLAVFIVMTASLLVILAYGFLLSAIT